MSKRLITGWVPLLAVTLVLAAALAMLYLKAGDDDPVRHIEDISALRQLKQLDAQWERDVLRSRIGINTDYDPLNVPKARLSAKHGLFSLQGPASEAASATLAAALEKKAGLIETFKSHNAVLRNSLAFLPTALEDIGQAAPAHYGIPSPEMRAAQASAARALLLCMTFSQLGDTDDIEKLESELAELARISLHLPAAVALRAGLFRTHAQTVLREAQTVGKLLDEIAAVRTGAAVDAISNLVVLDQEAGAIRSRASRRAVFIVAGLLSALLLFAAGRLILSDRNIRRLNRDLLELNVSLEHRVEQRTAELHAAQAALISTAHRAGMSEIAANVLHNVGNVLNSVNLSAQRLGAILASSETLPLRQALTMLEAKVADLPAPLNQDAKTKLLLAYLGQVGPVLASEYQGLDEELKALVQNIDHIKEIVVMQQSYAGCASVLEAIRPQDLVHDALRMSTGVDGAQQIELQLDLPDLPPLLLDRHRILSILVNLILNAKQALQAESHAAPSICLKLELREQQLLLHVSDNGAGITPENLARIFVHGFTTRRAGNGFGLHSCAIAASEMGGTICAHSEGAGRGARFTLEVPVEPAGQLP